MNPWLTLTLADAARNRWELDMDAHIEPAFDFIRQAHILCKATLDQHPKSSTSGDTDQELLAEENHASFAERHRVLGQWPKGRRHGERLRWLVSGDDIEVLLQALNDLRIYSWLQLGSPDPLPAPAVQHFDLRGFPDDPNSLRGALEIASVMQESLLMALDQKQDQPPASSDDS